ARSVPRAGDMAALELLPRADIEEIQRSAGIVLPLADLLRGVELDPETCRHPIRRPKRSRLALLGRCGSDPSRATLALESGEVPPHRAVLQRDDAVRNAGVAQRLAAYDAARAAGAVHHHQRLRVGGEVVNPPGELGS